MSYPSIFNPSTTTSFLERIEKLTDKTEAKWGKMSVAQMLAHNNLTYDVSLGKIPVKNSGFKKFLLKLLVKKMVVNEKPYKKNGMTAPYFLVSDSKVFEEEKNKLIQNIKEVEALGEAHFEGKESPSFGPMTSKEWNNQFYKHLDHHLTQFGV